MFPTYVVRAMGQLAVLVGAYAQGWSWASEVDTGHGKLIAVTLAGSMFMWVTVLLARCTGAYPCQDASWHEQAVAKPMQQIQVELDTGKKKFGPPNVCPSSLLVK